MVRTCAYPRCGNILKKKRLLSLQSNNRSSHRFPTRNPERLMLWFLALHMDINTPVDFLTEKRVCSDHFCEDDFHHNEQGRRRFLKASAVPLQFLPQAAEYPSHESQESLATQNKAELICEEAGLFFADVPQSTPVKQHNPGPETTTTQFSDAHLKLLVLTSPESARKQTNTSTSGTYYALPPIRSQLSPMYIQPEQTTEQYEDSLELSVSMQSIDPPSDEEDISFQPLSSTSTSSPSSDDDDEYEINWKATKWIVNEPNVMELFKRCQECGSLITKIRKATVGSLLRVHWECENKHKGQWSSCADVRGMPVNNLLVSASTLVTGATYTDINDWASILHLQLPKKSTFYEIQSSYLIPVINEEYEEQQKAIVNDLHVQNELCNPVHLSGDGRSDSPGFSAKYNTYSLMDDKTDKIVHFELVQVSEASSSVAMEPIGFRRGVDKLLEQGIQIDVLTTDRSPSIRKIMRVEYPNIHHEFDVWHVVKGFFKKLLSISRHKENQELQPWIRSICNHLWYSCATCGGDPNELLVKWKSILYHIVGVHSWIEEGNTKKCDHNDLNPEQQWRKKWLQKESHAYRTLERLVLDKRLLNDLRQMALFKHTGELEVFHSALLKYCSKSLHFHYTSMVARTQLAVLDHNENVGRQQAATITGVPRYNIVYPKHTKEWIAKVIYKPTTQNFRETLLEKVLLRRQNSSIVFKDSSSHLSQAALPQNIALKPRPDKQDVIAKRLSRFGRGPM
ncbi:uncharacterized protein [Misgurnus anguillicaudatus]|uniref:uncharacterized protein n=1 Tax=Misgurnus anguillicaudatus TaxID=75329 RepID=UPI003CCFC266